MPSASALSEVELEARQLVERLGGRWAGQGGTCRCPAHDDRTPSLSIRPGRTRLLLHCFAGCQAADILRALGSARLLDKAAPPAAGFTRAGREPPDLRAAALRLWGAARPVPGTLAGHYLSGRGVPTDSGQLRFHARTPDGPIP